MNNSHIFVVGLMLVVEAFDEYLSDSNLTLNVNLASMLKVLKCAKPHHVLILEATGNNPQDLMFKFLSNDKVF